MTDRTATLSFSDGSPPVTFPIHAGHHRPGRHRHPGAVRQDRRLHLRPRLHVDRRVQLGDHLHRRRQGRAALSRLSDRGAGDALRLPRDLPPAAVRRVAQCPAEGGFRQAGDVAHAGQRADALLPARISPQLPPDGRADRAGRRAVGVLPGLDESGRCASARHLGHPPDRQDADTGLDGLQVHGRRAEHVPAEPPVVRRQLHAHDVRDALRGVQGQRGAGPCARPHLHPSCRSRAERVDVDGAPVRLVRHQSVRGDRRGCRLPVGARAWRRQRGGAEHALRHPAPGRRRQDRRIHRQGQGQGLAGAPDGLRPSRLQELRSRGQS